MAGSEENVLVHVGLGGHPFEIAVGNVRPQVTRVLAEGHALKQDRVGRDMDKLLDGIGPKEGSENTSRDNGVVQCSVREQVDRKFGVEGKAEPIPEDLIG